MLDLGLPPRPVQRREDVPVADDTSSLAGRPRPKAGAPPPNFEPPREALLFPNGQPADYAPWQGNHPEDALSETTVKTGFVNKSQTINESNTARPALYGHMKNKAGLQSLSALFVNIFEKRQAARQVNAKPTFKAPPRVTLTNPRREAWLQALADTNIPLKRIHKTIPYGIGGKALLEQCLAKKIPPVRAIWLAKWVGINELRAYKRKDVNPTVSMSAENRFCKEWTGNFEQFLDGIMSVSNPTGWGDKMRYACGLVKQFYDERLIDRDQFLHWIITCMENGRTERLPIFLQMVGRTYIQDIAAFRQRGRRFGEALLNQIRIGLESEDAELFSQNVLGPLDAALKLLVFNFPDCLILPDSWFNHAAQLSSFISRNADSLEQRKELDRIVQQLTQRNRFLYNARSGAHLRPTTPVKDLLALLDAVPIKVDLRDLSSQCLALLQGNQLITTVLKWACTYFRQGEYRIYLATRLLRKWSRMNIELERAILEILGQLNEVHTIDVKKVFRIVAHLVCSGDFSYVSYLQWLIATGSVTGYDKETQGDALHLRLLTEMCLDNQPSHVENLRRSLLQQIGFSIDTEAQQLASAQDTIIERLPSTSNEEGAQVNSSLSEFNTGIKLQLSRFLRQQVGDMMTVEERRDQPEAEVCNITTADFYAVRAMMEELGDHAVLADILDMATRATDFSVLTAVADTINYHLRTFAAIGALQGLLDALLKDYHDLRAERPPDRRLLMSLIDLAQAAEVSPTAMQSLVLDLRRCYQKTAVAVCSPASDNMVDILQGSAVDSDEEIERILTSGSIMDEQSVARVFSRIVKRLEERIFDNSANQPCISNWLFQLRSFDEKTFMKLLRDWVMLLLSKPGGGVLPTAVPVLVGSGCLMLSDFADMVEESIDNASGQPSVAAKTQIALDALELILPNEALAKSCHIFESYRFRIEQWRFSMSPPSNIWRILRTAMGLSLREGRSDLVARLHGLLETNQATSVARYAIVADYKAVVNAMLLGSEEDVAVVDQYVNRFIDFLFDPTKRLELQKQPMSVQIASYVEKADELSLPFAQFKLHCNFNAKRAQEDPVKNPGSLGFSEAMVDAAELCWNANRWEWVELLPNLDGSIGQKIRQKAEDTVLADAEDFVNDRRMNHTQDELHRLLKVMEITASTIPTDRIAVSSAGIVIPGLIIKYLQRIIGFLRTGQVMTSNPEDVIDIQAADWLLILLKFALIHKPSFFAGKQSGPLQVRLLGLLRSLLINEENVAISPSIRQLIFDMAAYFSDYLHDDARAKLTAFEMTSPIRTMETDFLFGATRPTTGWIRVYKTQTEAEERQALLQQQFRAAQVAQAQSPTLAQRTPPTPQMRALQGNMRSTPGPSSGGGGAGGSMNGMAGLGKLAEPVGFTGPRWGLLPDAAAPAGPASVPAPNDTSVSLTLFETRRV